MNGGEPDFQLIEFNGMKNESIEDTTRGGPKRLTLTKGLNLIGYCSNVSCADHKKEVIIQKGCGQFNIAREKERSACPTCKVKLHPSGVNNLGFYECDYEIEGKIKGE